MDVRDINHKWWDSFDEKKMECSILFDEGEGILIVFVIPVKYAVCGTCDGRGKHVNPNIDRGGLSAEDLAEDPDFAEAYFDGAYDVLCNECNGKRVVPVPVDHLDAQLQEAYDERVQSMYDTAREIEHERKYGL